MMQQVTHVNFRELNINGRSTELNVEIVMTSWRNYAINHTCL